MKQTVTAVLLVLGLAWTSPASETKKEEAKKPLRIGLSFDSLAVERWQKDRDIFIAAAKDLGAECYFLSAEGDARTQNEQPYGQSRALVTTPMGRGTKLSL